MSKDLKEQLRDIVRSTELFHYIQAVREVNPPGAWIVGGALRNSVWKRLHGEHCTLEVNDIDVPYFSASLPMEANQRFVDELERVYPTGKWECDNQAWVHLYEPRTDYWQPHAPYHSLEESMVDFWFSVNTIGIRLTADDQIEILPRHWWISSIARFASFPFIKTIPIRGLKRKLPRLLQGARMFELSGNSSIRAFQLGYCIEKFRESCLCDILDPSFFQMTIGCDISQIVSRFHEKSLDNEEERYSPRNPSTWDREVENPWVDPADPLRKKVRRLDLPGSNPRLNQCISDLQAEDL
jgi:uncharacterized protein